MRTAAMFCLLLLVGATYVSATLPPVNFAAVSVRSDIFAPLRPNRAPELITGCGGMVTEPFGLLEHIFKRDEVPEGTTCTFRLRAPTSHRVNIIVTAFDLMDATSNEDSDYNESKASAISFYDSEEPGKNLMTSFIAYPRERAGGYVQSISSSGNMVVQIKYRDNIDYATQRFRITYEFLDAQKMIELLNAQ